MFLGKPFYPQMSQIAQKNRIEEPASFNHGWTPINTDNKALKMSWS
jgi:hypothetical protein